MRSGALHACGTRWREFDYNECSHQRVSRSFANNLAWFKVRVGWVQERLVGLRDLDLGQNPTWSYRLESWRS